MRTIITVLLLMYASGTAEKSEAWMLPPEMIRSNGYPCEEHRLETGDGYFLSNYRIPGGKGGGSFDRRLPPVLLVHGMLTSSKDFLLLGNKSLGYILADAGYDVWLTNMRYTETAYHRNRSRDDNSYWDFGLHEHADYDISESMEYVLNETKAEKLIYIGYSMGNTIYTIICNERPDLKERIAAYVALAPPFFATNFIPLIRAINALGLMDMLANYGYNHFSLSDNMRRIAVNTLCTAKRREEDLCYKLLFMITGEDWEQVDWDNSPSIFGRYMAATIKQVNHYVQHIATGVLSKYDYGPEENLKRYGDKKPPAYDLKSCTAPTVLYYGENDRLTSKKDVKKLLMAMRGTKASVHVRTPRMRMFNHLDFISASNATEILYDDVIKTLKVI